MRRQFGLPLLTKELLEQAARRRTYVIRTLYAALLFFFALLMFYLTVYQQYTNPLDILGRGREIFMSVVGLQFAGIFLFMPAITCTVITAEKERNTFGLLLLTRLGPTTILLEKLLGRLAPMGSFLLMSLPLMGFAYSLGGVAQQQVWIAVWALLLTTLQVGALALACSAFFRTTVQAFIGTYVIGFLMYFGWPILVDISDTVRSLHEFYAESYIALVNSIAASVWPMAGQAVRFDVHPSRLHVPFLSTVTMIDGSGAPLWWVIPFSAPTIASIGVCLVAARLFVVCRAFVESRNLLLKIFRQLDAAFHRLNENRVTQGIVLIKESVRLPGDEPIAWRETHKKSLGTIRYLIRFFVATEVPILLLCCSVAMSDMSFNTGASEAVSVLFFMVWIMAALLVTVKGATLISGERSHETLDVLLATPLRSVDIIRQKFRGVRRLMIVLACPLLTVVLFQTYFRLSTWSHTGAFQNFGSRINPDPFLYMFGAIPAVLIYLPLLAWLSFAIGLRIKSQTRAIFASLALIVVWCALPFITGIVIHEGFRSVNYRESPLSYIFLLSPISVIAFSEFSELTMFNSTPWIATFVNWLIYGGLLIAVREWCLLTASRRLGRSEVGPGFRAGVQKPRAGFRQSTRPSQTAAG